MRAFFFLTAATTLALLAGTAHAQDEVQPLMTPQLVLDPGGRALTGEKPVERSFESTRHWLALTVNPVATLIGRWGGNVEILPVAHHGIVLSGSYVSRSDCCTSEPSASAGSSPSSSSLLRGGFGELGYRYYTGSHGPTGLFVGPSLVTGGIDTGAEGTISLVGAALDVGGQLMFHGFVFGAGLGVQALHASRPVTRTDDPTVDVLTQTAISPRMLATVGYAL